MILRLFRFQYTFTQNTPKTVTTRLFHRQFLSYLPWWIVFRSSGCNTNGRPIQKHQGALPNDQAMVLYLPLPSHKCLGLQWKKRGMAQGIYGVTPNPCINMQMNVFHNNNNNKQMIIHFNWSTNLPSAKKKTGTTSKNPGQLDWGTYVSFFFPGIPRDPRHSWHHYNP